MIEKELHIPSDAHDILRDYAAGPHYTNDLMIKTANKVERALELAGVGPYRDYPAGVMTRRFSRKQVRDLPDHRFHQLRNPDLDIPWVGASDGNKIREQKDFFGTSPLDILRDNIRNDIAETVNASPSEISNGYIKRLLDKPEICGLLIQYFNEHQIAKFREYIADNLFYRLGKHRLHTNKNRARHNQPATLGSYIARTFCPDDMPAIVSAGQSEPSNRDDCLAARADLMRHLPIDPDAISDESIVKVGLAPHDFNTYTLQARRRFKMAVAPHFLALLAEAKMTERTHAGGRRGDVKQTARVITFTGADEQKKIGIFSTVTDVSTQVQASAGKEKNRHHRLADTELRIFAGREEAIRSQEHALEKMEERVKVYSELHNNLSKYSKKEGSEKSTFLSELVKKMKPYFLRKTGYYDQLILGYLDGSQKGVPTASIVDNPRIIGTLKSTLKRAMRDMRGKIGELYMLKKQIEKDQG